MAVTRACLPRGAGSQLLEGPQGSLSGFPPAGWGIRDIDGQSGKAADAGILAGGVGGEDGQASWWQSKV